MPKLSLVKPQNISDYNVKGNWKKNQDDKQKTDAIKTLNRAKELEEERLASGLWQWQIVHDQFGKPFKKLVRV